MYLFLIYYLLAVRPPTYSTWLLFVPAASSLVLVALGPLLLVLVPNFPERNRHPFAAADIDGVRSASLRALVTLANWPVMIQRVYGCHRFGPDLLKTVVVHKEQRRFSFSPYGIVMPKGLYFIAVVFFFFLFLLF